MTWIVIHLAYDFGTRLVYYSHVNMQALMFISIPSAFCNYETKLKNDYQCHSVVSNCKCCRRRCRVEIDATMFFCRVRPLLLLLSLSLLSVSCNHFDDSYIVIQIAANYINGH